METEIKNKVVVVTGGASGIGLAIADEFLNNGCKFAYLIDIHQNRGDEAVKSLVTRHGEKVAFIRCDVTKDLERVSKEILDNRYVDVLVNSAGITNENALKKTIEINAVATMDWTMKFWDQMRTDRGGEGGTIINLSSIFGFNSRITAYFPYYHASKFAVLGFSRSLGHKSNYKKYGVRIITVCPGMTMDTNLGRDVEDYRGKNEFEKTLPREYKFQSSDIVGQHTMTVFQKASSGSVWIIEGGKVTEKMFRSLIYDT